MEWRLWALLLTILIGIGSFGGELNQNYRIGGVNKNCECSTVIREIDGIEFQIVKTANRYIRQITNILVNSKEWRYHYVEVDWHGRTHFSKLIPILNCLANTGYWILERNKIPFQGVYSKRKLEENPLYQQVVKAGEDGLAYLNLPKNVAENSFTILEKLALLSKIEGDLIETNPHLRVLFEKKLTRGRCKAIQKHSPYKVWGAMGRVFTDEVFQMKVALIKGDGNYLFIYGKSVQNFADHHRQELEKVPFKYNPYPYKKKLLE